MPQEVVTTCGRLARRVAGILAFPISRFADRDLAVEATSGTIDQQGRTFTHSFRNSPRTGNSRMFDFSVIGGVSKGGTLCEPMPARLQRKRAEYPEAAWRRSHRCLRE